MFSRYRTVSAAVAAVIPADFEVSVLDIMVGLEAMEPGRFWRRRPVDSNMCRMREKGLIRRVKRATVHEPASYVRADIPIQEVPSVDMTLMQAIAGIHSKPMTSTEIGAAILEAGYQTAMGRNNLRNTITRAMGGLGTGTRTGGGCLRLRGVAMTPAEKLLPPHSEPLDRTLNPDWSDLQPVHNWRSRIPEAIREAWKNLSDDAKVVAYILAESVADSEEWD